VTSLHLPSGGCSIREGLETPGLEGGIGGPGGAGVATPGPPLLVHAVATIATETAAATSAPNLGFESDRGLEGAVCRPDLMHRSVQRGT
jgi:hypothetical protein